MLLQDCLQSAVVSNWFAVLVPLCEHVYYAHGMRVSFDCMHLLFSFFAFTS